jgi:hypothetical protein
MHGQRIAWMRAAWKADGMTGDEIYGYVLDSCADDNFWCQDDTYHLDISRPYLTGMDMVGNKWNGRKIHWRYLDGAAPGCGPGSITILPITPALCDFQPCVTSSTSQAAHAARMIQCKPV